MRTSRKYVLSILVFFAIATPVFGQVVPAADPVSTVYQSSLRQLIALLQQEVALLVAQLQSISDNQAKITSQLQQMQQPVQNNVIPQISSPVVTQVTPDVKINTIPVPTTIKVVGVVPGIIHGGNCTLVTQQVEVDDQFGKNMDIPIQVYDEQTQSTSTLLKNYYSDGTFNSLYLYKPQATSTTDIFTFSAGNLSTKNGVNIGVSYFDQWRNDLFMLQSNAIPYDPITGKCL